MHSKLVKVPTTLKLGIVHQSTSNKISISVMHRKLAKLAKLAEDGITGKTVAGLSLLSNSF